MFNRLWLFFSILVACSTLTAASRLSAIKGTVQYEIEQKEASLKTGQRISEAIKSLRRGQINDGRVLKALALIDQCAELQEKLKAANTRQASVSEEIGQLLKDTALSAQESTEYRNSSLALAELANVQNKLMLQLADLQKFLENYAKRLPAPQTLTLSSGLALKLVPQSGASAPFYASVPVSVDFARKYLPDLAAASGTPGQSTANLTYNQATQLVKAVNAAEGIGIRLPAQPQLEAMAAADIRPAVAVWSAEPFTMKNSLARSKQRLRGSETPIDKLQLTTQQSNAVSRFKIQFQTFWDPDHKLGSVSFNRELPGASYKDLGVIVVASSKLGADMQMQELLLKHNQQKLQNKE